MMKTVEYNYNKETFLKELEESLIELKEMRKQKQEKKDSSWRDLFNIKDK